MSRRDETGLISLTFSMAPGTFWPFEVFVFEVVLYPANRMIVIGLTAGTFGLKGAFLASSTNGPR